MHRISIHCLDAVKCCLHHEPDELYSSSETDDDDGWAAGEVLELVELRAGAGVAGGRARALPGGGGQHLARRGGGGRPRRQRQAQAALPRQEDTLEEHRMNVTLYEHNFYGFMSISTPIQIIYLHMYILSFLSAGSHL